MTMRLRVVSQEETEAADFVVCLRVGASSPFTDNVTDVCAHCGHAIFYRPYMPKKPPKICIECAVELGEANGKPVH